MYCIIQNRFWFKSVGTGYSANKSLDLIAPYKTDNKILNAKEIGCWSTYLIKNLGYNIAVIYMLDSKKWLLATIKWGRPDKTFFCLR